MVIHLNYSTSQFITKSLQILNSSFTTLFGWDFQSLSVALGCLRTRPKKDKRDIFTSQQNVSLKNIVQKLKTIKKVTFYNSLFDSRELSIPQLLNHIWNGQPPKKGHKVHITSQLQRKTIWWGQPAKWGLALGSFLSLSISGVTGPPSLPPSLSGSREQTSYQVSFELIFKIYK